MAGENKRGVFELLNADLTSRQFQKVSEMVHRMCGIKLRDGKQALVRSRLMKRLRALGLSSFKEYFKYLENDKTGRELGNMIDVITTGTTRIILDLSRIDFMDSTGLASIMSTMKTLAGQGEVVLCGLSENLKMLFSIAKLDRGIIRFFDSRTEALNGF